MQKTQTKEFARMSHLLGLPLETPGFAPDGIMSIWLGLRDRAVLLSEFHSEEARTTKSRIIEELGELRQTIKTLLGDTNKEFATGFEQIVKGMEKFSEQAQLLGKWIPVAETNPKALSPRHDPYVLWRQVTHTLRNAVQDENERNDRLLNLQNRCQHYETIVIQTVQKAVDTYSEQATRESQFITKVTNDLQSIATKVSSDRDWQFMSTREPAILPSDYKPRDPTQVTFPFSEHELSKPLFEGPLNRKSTRLRRIIPAYYVLTPSGFFLEYKGPGAELFPEPSLSLKLADCELRKCAPSDPPKFIIHGKDPSKSFGGRTHNYVFRCDGTDQIEEWLKMLKYGKDVVRSSISSMR